MTKVEENQQEERKTAGGTAGGPSTLGGELEPPFCLRNLLVSLLLMSYLTVEEKLEIMFKIFDYNDGLADGLDLRTLHQLTRTCYERNLYFMPSHELANTVELVFEGTNNLIYKAVLTKEDDIDHSMKYALLEQAGRAQTIDVTKELQKTFSLYQRLFGNKVIDFNFDTAIYKSIDDLLGDNLPSDVKRSPQLYTLKIFYETGQERAVFEV